MYRSVTSARVGPQGRAGAAPHRPRPPPWWLRPS